MNENIESDELKENDIVKISHMINIPNYSLLNKENIDELISSLIIEFEEQDINILSINNNNNDDMVEVIFSYKKDNDTKRKIAENYFQERLMEIDEISSKLSFSKVSEIDTLFGKCEKMKKDSEHLILNNSCSICFEEFKEGDWYRVLPQCSHIFHKTCVHKWLKKKAQCPVCRCNLLKNHLEEYYKEKAIQYDIQLDDLIKYNNPNF